MTPSKTDKNKHGVTFGDFDKEVAFTMKNYLLIKPSKSGLRKIISMWRKGESVSDTISYLILSAK